MATILAHITIKEGSEAAFEAIARTLHRASHDTETHLRAYGYWRGAEPRTYYTLLSFDSYLGFLEHQTSDHHEEASPGLGACIESMRLEWVDPIGGASTFVPTGSQPVPEGSSELMVKYAKRFPAAIADWWTTRRSAIDR
jgi:quinol monooxygenase YgiN